MSPKKTTDLHNILTAVNEARDTLAKAMVIKYAPEYIMRSIRQLDEVSLLINKDLSLLSQGVQEEFKDTAGASTLNELKKLLSEARCKIVSEKYDCLLGQMFVSLKFQEGKDTLSVRIFETGELEYHNVEYNDIGIFALQLGIANAPYPRILGK